MKNPFSKITQTTQDQSLNLIKILGAVAVVLNHLLYPVFARADFFQGKGWWVATFLYSASVVAVPLFIIINGYLLLPKKEELSKIYWRIFHRLLVPLVFWFGFYLVWRNFYYPVKYTLANITGVILSGSLYHYYFLVILIGLQLLLPVWRLIIEKGKDTLIHLVGAGSLVVGLATYFISYSGLVSGSGMTLVSWWLPFTAYFWWGYWRRKLPKAPSFYWVITAVSMFFLIVFLSHMGIDGARQDINLMRKDGIFYWHSLVGLPVLIMSIAVFEAVISSQLVKRLVESKLTSKVVSWLAPLTYGVYLSHFFVIEWVDLTYNYAIEFVQTDVRGFIVTRTVIVLTLSFTISFILNKLPIVKKVVGVNK